jgi:hypothetical protein
MYIFQYKIKFILNNELWDFYKLAQHTQTSY